MTILTYDSRNCRLLADVLGQFPVDDCGMPADAPAEESAAHRRIIQALRECADGNGARIHLELEPLDLEESEAERAQAEAAKRDERDTLERIAAELEEKAADCEAKVPLAGWQGSADSFAAEGKAHRRAAAIIRMQLECEG